MAVAIGAVLAFCFFVFIVVWVSLTFTNTLCNGTVGVCFKKAQPAGNDGACATCAACPTSP